jgi:peptide/nickel transport system permease protein
MSAVLTDPPPVPAQESPGLWTLAWRRLRQDTVGMVSLAIVAFFLLVMAAAATGLIAKDWSKEKGVSYANPSFLAGAENLEAKAMAARDIAKTPPVDLSDIDPLAPRYKEWEERAAKIAVTEVKRAESLPLGATCCRRSSRAPRSRSSSGSRARSSPPSSAPSSGRWPDTGAAG